MAGPNDTTVYYLTVSQGVCTNPNVDSTTVNLQALPTGDAGNASYDICAGDSVQIGVAPVVGIVYSWSPVLGLSNPNISNPMAGPNDTTVYYLSVTQGLCTNPNVDSTTVNVMPLPVIDTTLMVVTDASCNSSNGSIVGVTVTGVPTFLYSWSNGSTQVDTTLNLLNQPLGNYTLTVTDGNNCTSFMGPVQINGGNPPVINLDSIVLVDPSCNLANGSITNVLVTGGTMPYSYVWTLNNVVIDTTPAINQLLGGWYVLTVTDSLGCFGVDSVFVTSSANVTVVANDDYATTPENIAVQINPSNNDQGGSGVNVLWGPFNGVATGSVLYTPNTSFFGRDSISYEICDLVCVNICDTAIIYITIQKDRPIHIYNGLSPNDDGINETFYIENIDLFPENELTIYNRWGDQVYTAAPYNNEWDGTSQTSGIKLMGNKVVDGTYFFILKLKPDAEPVNGTIDLRR